MQNVLREVPQQGNISHKTTQNLQSKQSKKKDSKKNEERVSKPEKHSSWIAEVDGERDGRDVETQGEDNILGWDMFHQENYIVNSICRQRKEY